MNRVARLVGLGSAAALAAAVAFVATYSADAATETLLSQGKPATASSVETTALGPANAVDGNAGTRWASAEGVDPQWIRVDLGGTQSITHVALSWEAAYGKAYQIQTSANGTNWTTIYSTTTGNGGSDDLTGLSGSGRYVRVNGTARGTQWGYSLWEFKVYGPGGTVPTTPPPSSGVDLTDPHKKDIAMQLVSSAENSSLDWRAQYSYIEDIGDGRGYTAGIIGFCSGTGDMLEVVQRYQTLAPNNILVKYLPALRSVNGTSSHAGLDPNFTRDWRTAAADPLFQQAQDAERDATYFNPAVQQAKADGLRALGQFIYYDAIVMHGPGTDPVSFGGIRRTAMSRASTPAQGGSEVTYLNAFLDARKAAMQTEEAHSDTSRVDTAQRVFLQNGNLDLNPPLSWHVYGDPFTINALTVAAAPATFAHPGVFISRAQLDFVRGKVLANAQPWKAAYDQMMASSYASLTRTPKPRSIVECGSYSNPNLGCTDERQDALAAYTLSLAWYVTRDTRYAAKAISIMDAWSAVITDHTNSNAPLQAGWAASSWPRAAEIIRYTYTGGWTNVNRFATMLRTVYLPEVINGRPTTNGNWELTMMEAAIGISVFLEDRTSYDKALATFRARVPAYLYLTTDGSVPKGPAGTSIDTPAEIISYWQGQSTFVNGLSQETCRDFTHTGYGISSISHVAETTRIQGQDLYPELQDRLRHALGFHAKYQLGEAAPSWLCGGSLTKGLGPISEVAFNALHNRLGIAMTNTQTLTEQSRPAGTNGLFVAWETLTHANNPA